MKRPVLPKKNQKKIAIASCMSKRGLIGRRQHALTPLSDMDLSNP